MLEQDQTPAAGQGFDAGETIIGHVSNSAPDHPLLHLPTVFGINLSVSKHVFMLWLVAALVFLIVTTLVRRHLRNARHLPSGAPGALEVIVEFIRDGIARPNVGDKWVKTWTPLLLTMFVFILSANVIGLIPIFEVLGLIDHLVLHSADHSFVKTLLHGSATATGNYNVTAGLALITFMAIIVAGTRAHGFVKHWTNLVPHGMPLPLYALLIPMELISMLVRPFALTMRLAANMTGGHIAILAILSFVFIFAEMLGALGGIGVGLLFSVPLSAAIYALEIIVVLVQAYVFTLLSAVFIGMAIHVHH
ncbi:MAG TPA: F0F1 ATP synthase subunit A [Vicinamibacterales bacterium]|nr:F0F1 ATP synthase subunit A [Vicinamibacterales bacterium]